MIILLLLFSKYSPKIRFAQQMCYAGIKESNAFLYIHPRLAMKVGRRGVIILILLLGKDKTHVCLNSTRIVSTKLTNYKFLN